MLCDTVSFGALEVQSGDMKSNPDFIAYNCDNMSTSLT